MKVKRMLMVLSLSSCLLIVACAVFRDRKQLEKNSETSAGQYENRNLLFHYRQRDSLFTYWYLQTDSLFSFRPDSGLNAKGGRLYVHQSWTSAAEENMRTDQNSEKVISTVNSVLKQEKKDVRIETIAVILGLGVLVVYFSWKLWRK